MKKIIIFIALFIPFYLSAQTSSFFKTQAEENEAIGYVNNAEFIFEGRIINSESKLLVDTASSLPYTLLKIQIVNDYKSNIKDSFVYFISYNPSLQYINHQIVKDTRPSMTPTQLNTNYNIIFFCKKNEYSINRNKYNKSLNLYRFGYSAIDLQGKNAIGFNRNVFGNKENFENWMFTIDSTLKKKPIKNEKLGSLAIPVITSIIPPKKTSINIAL
jgi:hypothetical protein